MQMREGKNAVHGAMSGIARRRRKKKKKKTLSMAKVSSMSSSSKIAARSSSLIERSNELHPDAVTEARLAALNVSKQNLRDLARRPEVVLADDLDAQ